MLRPPFAIDNFYAINSEILQQSIEESKILYELEMGGGISIYYGVRFGRPVWLLKNPGGLSAAWYDDKPITH